jgi:probable F420-dependent oxidoreductase
MKFTVAIAMSPLEQLGELARTAEECGYDSVALPDSLFYSEEVSATYPYTPDAFVAAASMAAVTSRIRFYTQVLKLNPRNPVLLARQVGSVAVLTGNRFGLGVGLGWPPEETRWCGAEFEHRGARADEAIEVLRLILGGGMVEHHGRFYDFGRLRMSPAPTEPVPVYVGGHTEPALRRAARTGDGWTSAMISFEDLRSVISRLAALRAGYGRADTPFEVQAVCVDRFGLDGYRAQAEIGVTDAIVVPWVFYGVGLDGPLQDKKDGMKRFAEEIVGKL